MKIGILGAGAFGTSIAKNLGDFSKANHNVLLYCYEPEVESAINNKGENTTYLPGVKLSSNIKASANIKDLYSSDIIIITTPVKFIRSLLDELQDIPRHIPLIIASKGIENSTGMLVSNIIQDALSADIPVGVLTGPTFATELALHSISALVLATSSLELSEKLIKQLSFSNVRIYTSDDIIGCQLGGAVKNVLAIAAGIINGLDLGHNALAALLTRGLLETSRIIEAYGGNPQTAQGLSGLGDLVLTATSTESRNFSLGVAIGKAGEYNESIKGDKAGFSEGTFTAKSIYEISQKHNLYLPICTEVYKIIYEGKKLQTSINDLLDASIKNEF